MVFEWRTLGRDVVVASVATLIVTGLLWAAGILGGLLSTPLEVVLAALLSASVIFNVVLVATRRRRVSRSHMPATLEEAVASMEALDAQVEAAQAVTQRDDHWMETPGDLATLTLTNAELERLWERATAWATTEVARDAFLWFGFISLVDRTTVFFNGVSNLAQRRFTLAFSSPEPEGMTVLSNVRTEHLTAMVPEDREPPWRKDDRWRQLVSDSWVRVRPFSGHAMLTYEGGWSVCYNRRGSDEMTFPEECFHLGDEDEAASV